MRDQRLFELAAEHEELKAARDKIEAKRVKIADKIAGELEERGLKSIEGTEDNPFRITLVTRETPTFDEDKAKKVLGNRFKKICKLVIDKDAVHYLVQQEVISVDEMEKFGSIKYGKPWPKISELSFE